VPKFPTAHKRMNRPALHWRPDSAMNIKQRGRHSAYSTSHLSCNRQTGEPEFSKSVIRTATSGHDH
jgi:hypothetical protein